MNLVFRVDSGNIIGSGHLVRCLNIADFLAKDMKNIVFICCNHEGNLINKIKYKTMIIIKKENNWMGNTWQDDCAQTINILQKLDNIILIVDHYKIDYKWETKVKPYIKTLMVIDDLHDRKHNCDILLDQNLYINENPYIDLVPKHCKILLGFNYIILNSCFKRQRMRNEIKKVHICFGGSDIYNLTDAVLNKVKDLNLDFDVVLGPINKNFDMIRKKYNHCKNIKIYYSISLEKMEELLYNADLCIGGGGSSSYERCFSGCFSLVITIADNQIEIAKKLDNINIVKYIGDYKDDDIFSKLYVELNYYIDMTNYVNISKKCLNFIDNKGLKRIKNILISI